MTKETKLRKPIKKVACGAEAYNNAKFDKEFYKSDGYKRIEEDEKIQSICKKQGKDVKKVTQEFLNEGITEPEKIRESIKNDISPEEYSKYSKAGVQSVEQMEQMKHKNIDVETYEAYRALNITSIDEMDKLKKNGIDTYTFSEFKKAGISNPDKIKNIIDEMNTTPEIALSRLAYANKLKREGLETEDDFLERFKKEGLSEEEARQKYNRIKPAL